MPGVLDFDADAVSGDRRPWVQSHPVSPWRYYTSAPEHSHYRYTSDFLGLSPALLKLFGVGVLRGLEGSRPCATKAQRANQNIVSDDFEWLPLA
jgi:hypothetical protein